VNPPDEWLAAVTDPAFPHNLRRVRLLCTDRGQHQRIKIATVYGPTDGPVGTTHNGQWYNPPVPLAGPGELSRESYQFNCPHCTRQASVAAARWHAILDEIWRVGLYEYDLSYLD
jgi:hypothetical protein